MGKNSQRIDALTDGVFAIIATLLVLEVRLPQIPEQHTQEELLHSLADVVPSFVAFAFSFLTLLTYWVNHESLGRVIVRVPYRLMWLNLLLLFALSMVPFTTNFIAEYPREPVAVVTYGLVLCLTGVIGVATFWYIAFRADLLHASVTHEARRRLLRRWCAGPVLYALASVVAFIDVRIAIATYLFVPLLFFAPGLQEQVLRDLGE